jgi:hypothetical protein
VTPWTSIGILEEVIASIFRVYKQDDETTVSLLVASFHPEDESSTFLPKVSKFLPDYTASHPTRTPSNLIKNKNNAMHITATLEYRNSTIYVAGFWDIHRNYIYDPMQTRLYHITVCLNMGILQQLLLIFSHTEFHQNLLNIM